MPFEQHPEAGEDRGDPLLRDDGEEHVEGVHVVEEKVPFMEAVMPPARYVRHEGEAGNVRLHEQVLNKVQVLAAQDDLDLLH